MEVFPFLLPQEMVSYKEQTVVEIHTDMQKPSG